MEYKIPTVSPPRVATATRAPADIAEAGCTTPSPLTDFLRYHVLIRVFDGRPRAWLDILRKDGRGRSADARFLLWLDEQLHADPTLLGRIRETVDASGVWPCAD